MLFNDVTRLEHPNRQEKRHRLQQTSPNIVLLYSGEPGEFKLFILVALGTMLAHFPPWELANTGNCNSYCWVEMSTRYTSTDNHSQHNSNAPSINICFIFPPKIKSLPPTDWETISCIVKRENRLSNRGAPKYYQQKGSWQSLECSLLNCFHTLPRNSARNSRIKFRVM